MHVNARRDGIILFHLHVRVDLEVVVNQDLEWINVHMLTQPLNAALGLAVQVQESEV